MSDYEPSDPTAHYQRHANQGESEAVVHATNQVITACTICDPRRRSDYLDERERMLKEAAWNEGFEAGLRDSTFLTASNPYRKADDA